jgi:hypothetical protein
MRNERESIYLPHKDGLNVATCACGIERSPLLTEILQLQKVKAESYEGGFLNLSRTPPNKLSGQYPDCVDPFFYLIDDKVGYDRPVRDALFRSQEILASSNLPFIVVPIETVLGWANTLRIPAYKYSILSHSSSWQ